MQYRWSPATIDSLRWQPYNRSITKLSSPDKRRVHKFINNKLPNLCQNEKYYGYKSSLFPCCKLYSETEDHIIRCRIPSRQRIHDNWRMAIIEYLLKPHTPAEVKYSICNGFFNWLEKGRNHEFGQPRRPTDPNITSVAGIQQSIGWDHVVRGRMAIKWGNIINYNIATKPTIKQNAEDWGAKLLKISWKYIL
jgi:hypothetical protein